MKASKKLIGSMAMAALMAGSPVMLTSCDEDDVKTILDIIQLFTSTDELNGTQWANPEYKTNFTFYLVFSNGQVLLQEADEQGSAPEQRGSYPLDTSNNVLTLNLNTGTRRYTITQYTKGSSMTITSGNKTIRLVPYIE